MTGRIERTTYRATMTWGDTFEFAAQIGEPASHVHMDGAPTQYTVGDLGHDRERIADTLARELWGADADGAVESVEVLD